MTFPLHDRLVRADQRSFADAARYWSSSSRRHASPGVLQPGSGEARRGPEMVRSDRGGPEREADGADARRMCIRPLRAAAVWAVWPAAPVNPSPKQVTASQSCPGPRSGRGRILPFLATRVAICAARRVSANCAWWRRWRGFRRCRAGFPRHVRRGLMAGRGARRRSSVARLAWRIG